MGSQTCIMDLPRTPLVLSAAAARKYRSFSIAEGAMPNGFFALRGVAMLLLLPFTIVVIGVCDVPGLHGSHVVGPVVLHKLDDGMTEDSGKGLVYGL